MKINKKKLTGLIFQKVGKTIPKKDIYAAIGIICEYILEQITNNREFSISNFGTFSPYIFHGHNGYNLVTGRMQKIKSFCTAKFRPHAGFLAIVGRQRNKYQK